MDKNAVFEKVAFHLVMQNEHSRGEYLDIRVNGEREKIVSCRYRGEDGLSCAVGCLIPDELYVEEIEGASAQCADIPGEPQSRRERNAKLRAVLHDCIGAEGESDLKFLRELQKIHDFRQPEQWPSELATFARDQELELSEELASLLDVQ